MEVKFLAGLLLASLVSANALALDIKNGKLLSTEKKITHPASLEMFDQKKFSLAKKKLPEDITSGEAFFSVSMLAPTTGMEDESTDVSGHFVSEILNKTDATQIYKVERVLCAVIAENRNTCLITQSLVQLDAGGKVFDSDVSSMKATFSADSPAFTVAAVVISKMGVNSEFEERNISVSVGKALIESYSKAKSK